MRVAQTGRWPIARRRNSVRRNRVTCRLQECRRLPDDGARYGAPGSSSLRSSLSRSQDIGHIGLVGYWPAGCWAVGRSMTPVPLLTAGRWLPRPQGQQSRVSGARSRRSRARAVSLSHDGCWRVFQRMHPRIRGEGLGRARHKTWVMEGGRGSDSPAVRGVRRRHPGGADGEEGGARGARGARGVEGSRTIIETCPPAATARGPGTVTQPSPGTPASVCPAAQQPLSLISAWPGWRSPSAAGGCRLSR